MESRIMKSISELNSVFIEDWEIKARVVQKSEIRMFRNLAGNEANLGKLFSVHLEDLSGKIRAVAFGEACDRFHDQLQFNKVYSISNAQLKNSVPDNDGGNRWSNLPNKFEILLDLNSRIVELDDSDEIPRAQFEFISFFEIDAKKKDDVVDVIGFCDDQLCMDEFESNEGRQLTKLEISLVNETGSRLKVTLWNNLADTFRGQQKVVAIKNGRVEGFEWGNGVSVSLDSSLYIDPDVPEALNLRKIEN